MPVTAPFTVETVSEPGYGRSLARPPNTTIDVPSPMPGRSAWITSAYPISLIVASRVARSMS